MTWGSHMSNFHRVTQYGSKIRHTTVTGVTCDTARCQLWHPFTFCLGHQTSLASGPLPVQPLDGLITLGPLTPSVTLMSRSPYTCTSHKPSPGALPEVPLFGYSAMSQQHQLHTCGFNVSPRLVSDEGGMTFSYLWQVGSCGFVESYCFTF